jgi:hypothetical protein
MSMPGVNEWRPSGRSWVLVAVTWTLVGIPLLWGVYNTLKKALALFQ